MSDRRLSPATPEYIRRTPVGMIDYGYYEQRARALRGAAVSETVRALGLAFARRFARMIRKPDGVAAA